MCRAALRQPSGPGLALSLLAGALLVGPAGLHAQTLQHDTSLPIEITADQLEVVQQEQVAIFTGNVDAVQGELVLNADQLRVFYYRDGEDAAPAAASSGSIRRIEAEGNVFMSSPRETAQGEAGVYDVPSNQLTLEGSVVLTQDDNVVRGERLEMDLVSGRSRMLAAVEGGEPAQRVRAIFTPQVAPGAGPRAPAPESERPVDAPPSTQ